MKRVFRLGTGAGAVSQDVEREIEFHLEMRAREFRAMGLSDEEARRAAREAFGDIGAIEAECRQVRTRATRERERVEHMQNLRQDIRYALRTLRRAPGFTLVAVLTLALGIGATTAIFSVINGVLLRPLPFAYGDRIVHLTQPANGADDAAFSPIEVGDYAQQTTAMDGVVEYHSMSFTLLGRSDPVRVATGVVSAGFFDLFGVKPLLGRTFRPGEDQPGAAPVLVLSYDFWQKEFGGDPHIIGQTFEMNDRVHTVIGVLPFMPQYPDRIDVYMPISSCPFRSAPRMMTSRRHRMVTVFGRLKPGVQMPKLLADIGTISARLHREDPDGYRPSDGLSVRAMPLRDELTRAARPTLLVLLATAAFVLLIACANVANLTLARQVLRQRELALRVALGASRARMGAQLLTESTLLALVGGALGLLVASAGLKMLIAFAARFTPRAAEITIDHRVLLFTLVVSALTGIALGLLPALPGRANLTAGLKDGSGGATVGGAGQRLRGTLIVAQVAIAFVLLIGAGLMVRSFVKLQSVNPGFDPQNVLTAELDLNFTKYARGPQVRAFTAPLLERLRAQPGAIAVALGSTFPLSNGTPFLQSFTIDGAPPANDRQPPQADFRVATPDYFRALGVPMVRGREFLETDRDTLNVAAIINQTAARRYFRDGDPMGKRFTFDEGRHWLTVVGIAGDVKQNGLQADPIPEVYAPFEVATVRDVRVLVRSRANPLQLAQQLRDAVRALDPAQPVTQVQTLEQLRTEALASPKLTMVLLGSFATLALLITAAGLAGVISFSVGQRTREIGIRMALGAERGRVLAMVMRQGMALVIVGLVLGVGGALALTRLISGLLFDVNGRDPVTYACVGLVLLAVAALACFAPARRATTVDPMIALRGE